MRDDTRDPSAEVWHPSVFIKEELDARGWTRIDLAMRMGGDAQMNLLTWDMYRNVGPTEPNMMLGAETAQQMSRAFDVSPEFFLTLEAAWRARYVH